MRVIEYPRKDEELPKRTQLRIKEMLEAGYPREHLLISERGDVSFDPEASAYEAQMQVKHPELSRESYMSVVYPSRIVTDED
jgi:hypothetical protein